MLPLVYNYLMRKDKEIWNDFRRGEAYALTHIYNQHVNLLFRYGKKFCQDDELVKDTIQDLFFDLIRTRKNLGETDHISFYLMASFRRKLAKAINRKFPLKNSGDEEMNAEIIYSVEHDFIVKEDLTQREKAVKKALAQLTPKEREILFYRFICNFDYNQICELMKLRYDSARKQVSRALKSMKKILSASDMHLFFVLIFSKRNFFPFG